MDEDPELTFIRGEAAVYEHIERHDPETFARIVRYIEAGRWDVVGGTYVQPDTNLPATETFARHFLRGQSYFASRFGRTARVAWAADSFGHSAGLPLLLAEAGIEGFAFTRPGSGQVPLAKPAFWWEGPGGARVLGYRPAVGWYGCERDEVPKRLDGYLRAARQHGLDNVGVFYGVGNHGGGPTRRQIADIRAWAERHGDEVRVVHSSLHRLFDALRDEVQAKGEAFLPTHRGELNFCLRGCYVSVAKFKFAYRRAEASVARAERTGAAIAAALGTEAPAMDEAWDAVLFNAFHDILPGSSIERAFDDQIAWIGGAVHASQRAEMTALNALARRVDTAVPAPAEITPRPSPSWSGTPHPHPFSGHIELEGCLDYRPIWAYDGRPDEVSVEVRGPDGTALPFQTLETENRFTPTLPWRRRVLVPAELPPLGWSVLTMAWVENAEPAADTGGGGSGGRGRAGRDHQRRLHRSRANGRRRDRDPAGRRAAGGRPRAIGDHRRGFVGFVGRHGRGAGFARPVGGAGSVDRGAGGNERNWAGAGGALGPSRRRRFAARPDAHAVARPGRGGRSGARAVERAGGAPQARVPLRGRQRRGRVRRSQRKRETRPLRRGAGRPLGSLPQRPIGLPLWVRQRRALRL
jgi:alpha-mannosidase